MENLKIISLGMGVQSTCLYYMSSMGEIERCDYAIFVDTGKEKSGTIRYLKYLLQWELENNGIPIIVVKEKDLYKDLLNTQNTTGGRFSSIPAFTKNEDGSIGMLRRQCTFEYKIDQVDNTIRDLYNLKKRQRRPNTFVYKGISLDEIDRMTIPQERWKTHVYPFVGYVISRKNTEKDKANNRMTRTDIVAWYNKKGLPIPPKSACVFCPYQSDASYRSMKENEPEDWEAAINVDRAIRNSTKKGITQPIYLHRSLKPLDEIEFPNEPEDLWNGECSGVCHT